MPNPLLVLNVVGLTHDMLGPNSPHLSRLAADGFARPMGTVLPAVTCSVQSTFLTGLYPRDHGIVGNGWYFRDTAEVRFWLQSNHLVQGERIYQAARRRDPGYTTAKLFWWYNMYAPVDWSLTPRPSYPADGRKIFDSYSQPVELRDELQAKFGPFPLFNFWGPTADIKSSQWIVDASLELLKKHRPSLALVYLPHLDYNLQRLGPEDPRIADDIRQIDAEAGRLIEWARGAGYEVIALSEYAIMPVNKPVHINRVLREAGYLQVRREPLGWETLDAGASRAFAVADHQVAHIYIDDPADIPSVKSLLEKCDGVDFVLDRAAQAQYGIDHSRSGELVCVSTADAWFTYYFWLDDALAPDYARTVDIHRKPGYDPCELLVDPTITLPIVHIGWRLLQKNLGFRYLMDVIPLDARLIRGSHGRLPRAGKEGSEGPVFLSSSKRIERDLIAAVDVKGLMMEMGFNMGKAS